MNNQDILGEQLSRLADSELLNLISNNHNLYSDQAMSRAKQLAGKRGLISEYGDRFKIILPSGAEAGPYNGAELRAMFVDGSLNEKQLLYVDSQRLWLPLREIFDLSRWNQGEIEKYPTNENLAIEKSSTPNPDIESSRIQEELITKENGVSIIDTGELFSSVAVVAESSHNTRWRVIAIFVGIALAGLLGSLDAPLWFVGFVVLIWCAICFAILRSNSPGKKSSDKQNDSHESTPSERELKRARTELDEHQETANTDLIYLKIMTGAAGGTTLGLMIIASFEQSPSLFAISLLTAAASFFLFVRYRNSTESLPAKDNKLEEQITNLEKKVSRDVAD